MKQDELNEVLKKHKAWLNNEEDGERANLMNANLRDADLRGADLSDADLRGADLRSANLMSANLMNAELDMSCWPLWCGSRGAKVDKNIYTQLLAHLCAVDVDDEECRVHQGESLLLAKQSHIAKELKLR